MTLKKFLYLFWTTMLVGAVSTIPIGVVIEYQAIAGSDRPWLDLLVGMIWFAGAGILFSVVSQVGFFAYLVINSFGKDIFRGWLWPAIQVVLILLAVYDFAYLRQYFASEKQPFVTYLDLPLGLLAAAIVVAWLKVRATNRYAFIPTVFFMVIMTMVEWVPAVRGNNESSMFFMILPLFVCNTWQIMRLHRILPKRSG